MKTFLKKIALMVVTIVVAHSAASAQSKEVNRTVDFAAGGELRLNLDKTKLRVHSWDRNKVEVKGRIEAGEGMKDTDYARRAVEATKIEINGDARSLVIRTNFDDLPCENVGGWSQSLPQIYLDLSVPRRLALQLDADRSEIELRGVEGRLSLATDRTPLRAQDLTGEIHLKMDRGGKSELSGVRAKLEIETDRTDITLRSWRITGDSSFSIGRGRFDAYIPRAQGLILSADRDRRSNLQADFPITTRAFNSGRIEGEINGGGPRLAIRTDRASVYLKAE